VLFGSLALVMAIAVPVMTAGVGGALSYTPPALETKPCAAPSEAMTLNGSGFVPGAVAEISLGGTVLGTVVVSPSGTFSFGFTAPNATGSYQLSASDGTNSLSTTFRVATNCSGGGGGGGGGLPYTGTSSTPWLVRVGVGLLAVGAAFVALLRTTGRRRETERTRIDA